jgi:uncharacterized protein YbjT (DUF2867 family)
VTDKSEPILITGATGQQGGVLANRLLTDGYKVRALTRNPEKAQALRGLGAEIVVGDLKNRASLDQAFQSVKRVFLVTTPFEEGVNAEEKQGIDLIDAAKSAGVEYLVYSSVASAQRHTDIPHFESKWNVEQYLRRSGLRHSIIRPVFFMENFAAPWMLPALQAGKVVLPMQPDRPLQMIALQDIGEYLAAAIVHPEKFAGHEIDIAGDELRIPEALSLIAGLTGHKINYETMPFETAESMLGHDFTVMFKWFNEVGYNVDIPGIENQWGIKATRFRDWLKSSALLHHLS